MAWTTACLHTRIGTDDGFACLRLSLVRSARCGPYAGVRPLGAFCPDGERRPFRAGARSERAAALSHPKGHFIKRWLPRFAVGRNFAAVSPRDGQILQQVAQVDVADVDCAVAAARRAFDSEPWPRLKPRERASYLHRIADLIERDREKLALVISLEMGKPISDALGIEVAAAARTFGWYAELADKSMGEIPGTDDATLAVVTREPAGVVAAVVPWNFPLTMAAWKLAPALAAGCTVVLKPAEQSPLSALHLATLIAEAGLPDGVVNVVNGLGVVTGPALGLHRDVDVLTFTGSTEVGRHFLRYSADSNLKRVWLELGGKSPNIILADAPELDSAADTAAWGIFFNSGEMCTAPSRLIVERSAADQVIERCLPEPPTAHRVTRWIRRRQWVPWSIGASSRACSGTSALRLPRVPYCAPVGMPS
jgi:gamma-glutamyl-gamma-aminobutyraldehyde dehydrogenase